MEGCARLVDPDTSVNVTVVLRTLVVVVVDAFALELSSSDVTPTVSETDSVSMLEEV